MRRQLEILYRSERDWGKIHFWLGLDTSKGSDRFRVSNLASDFLGRHVQRDGPMGHVLSVFRFSTGAERNGNGSAPRRRIGRLR